MSDYILDRATERRRLAALKDYQDAPTIRVLEATGVTAGWRCLDAGAGAGSISHWLADRVGETGAVLAIDLDTSLLEERENLGVRRHDLRSGALPEAAFDLVHTRLVLNHLPEREDVLDRLVHATRPGGWVVVGDIDFGTTRLDRADSAFERLLEAYGVISAKAGGDPEIGPKLPGLLEQHGLTDVQADAFRTYQRGGGTGPSALRLTFERIRERCLALGLTTAEIDHAQALLADPAVGVYSPEIWTAWGRLSEASA
jgi:SAM-dependent methyltransferase